MTERFSAAVVGGCGTWGRYYLRAYSQHERIPLPTEPPTPAERMTELIFEALNERQAKIYRTRNDLDMAYELPGVARFRVNVFRTLNGPAAVFRLIPEETDIHRG